MKVGKCVGLDDIPIELWKLSGDERISCLTTLFSMIICSGKMTKEEYFSTNI